MDETPEALYKAGMAPMPGWNDDGPDAAARFKAAKALVARAAEAGHEEALQSMAQGSAPEAFDWSVRLAKAGNEGELVMNLTNGDHPVERCQEVFAAAQAGEGWAITAVARVYRLGMRDNATGRPVASRPLAWGWLPGAKDPRAEGLAWLKRAAAAGWASASYWLACATDAMTAEEALGHIRDALRPGGVLTASIRRAAGRLCAKLLDLTDAPLAERIEAFSVLAEGGDSEAQAWLGDRYRLGEGVAQDYGRARELYERAVTVGEVAALRELGRMHEEGLGGPVDDQKARELYEHAAELGADDFARDRLATKYGLTWYARGRRKRGAAPAPGGAAPAPAKAAKAAKPAKAKPKSDPEARG